MTNPISVYADPDRFEKERSQIFARSWQFVGLENDLVRKGDFLRDDVAGVSQSLSAPGRAARHR